MLLYEDDPTYGQYSSQNHIFTDVYRTLNPNDKGYTYGHQNPSAEGRIDFIMANDYLSNYLADSTVGDTATAGVGSDHYSVDFILNMYALKNQTDITQPGKVRGVSGEAISTSEINLSWDTISISDFDHYNVYRDGIKITETTSTLFSDTGLTTDTWYTYEISAVDTSDYEGLKSRQISIKTNAEPSVPEIFPFSLGLMVFLVLIVLMSSKYVRKSKEELN